MSQCQTCWVPTTFIFISAHLTSTSFSPSILIRFCDAGKCSAPKDPGVDAALDRAAEDQVVIDLVRLPGAEGQRLRCRYIGIGWQAGRDNHPELFDGDGLGQVAGFVDVIALGPGQRRGEYLQWNRG
jgi:hypothetical protein